MSGVRIPLPPKPPGVRQSLQRQGPHTWIGREPIPLPPFSLPRKCYAVVPRRREVGGPVPIFQTQERRFPNRRLQNGDLEAAAPCREDYGFAFVRSARFKSSSGTGSTFTSAKSFFRG